MGRIVVVFIYSCSRRLDSPNKCKKVLSDVPKSGEILNGNQFRKPAVPTGNWKFECKVREERQSNILVTKQ